MLNQRLAQSLAQPTLDQKRIASSSVLGIGEDLDMLRLLIALPVTISL